VCVRVQLLIVPKLKVCYKTKGIRFFQKIKYIQKLPFSLTKVSFQSYHTSCCCILTNLILNIFKRAANSHLMIANFPTQGPHVEIPKYRLVTGQKMQSYPNTNLFLKI